MNHNYTKKDFEQFFESFKRLPEYYEIGTAHKLINNSVTKPPLKSKPFYPKLKAIIMSLITIIVISVLFQLDTSVQKENTNFSTFDELIQEKKIEKMQPVNSSEQFIVKNSVSRIKNEKGNFNNRLIIKSTDKQTVLDSASNNNNISTTELSKKCTQENLNLKDTVFDGKKFIIKLSNNELEKLGFFIDPTGVYYKNIYNGNKTNFHSRWESNNGEITRIYSAKNNHNKKSAFSKHSFYPILVSEPDFNQDKYSIEEFGMMNDTLLPILILNEQLKYGEEEIIIWFNITSEIFNALPKRYKYLNKRFNEIKQLKQNYVNKDLVEYHHEVITIPVNFKEPSKGELVKLGFKIKDNKIQILTGKGITSWLLTVSLNMQGVQTEKSLKKQLVKPKGKLIFLSDLTGKQSLKWFSFGDNPNKMKKKYFDQKIQELVPILIKQNDYPAILTEDLVFWFEPNEDLKAILNKPFKKENSFSQTYNSITNSKTSNSNFKGNIIKNEISNFLLYPNPTKANATITFSLVSKQIGNIQLIDLLGKKLKTLVPETEFREGQNSYKLVVSDITPGIYLALIKTNNSYQTKRLIISD